MTLFRISIAFILMAFMSLHALAQTNYLLPSDFKQGVKRNTNVVYSLTSTNRAIRVVSMGAENYTTSGDGSLIVPVGNGDSAHIYGTADGGLQIREPGVNNNTYITPRSDGSLIVKGPSGPPIYVKSSGDGYANISRLKRDKNATYVTSSADGKSITVWTANGNTYSISVPESK